MNRVFSAAERQQLRVSAFTGFGLLFRGKCRSFTDMCSSRISRTMTARKPRIQLVLDFDGTITAEDTTAIIGGRCLEKARELALPGPAPEQLPKDMSYYSRQYFQEYKEWRESSTSSSPERKTIEEEVSYLSRSRQVELNSFLRVRDAVYRVPGGITAFKHEKCLRDDFMMKAGREAVRSGEVKVRDPDALKSLTARAHAEGNRWGILSVSWSRRFILGVLAESGILEQDSEEEVAKSIKSNELLAPLNSTENGGYDILCSAIDKKLAFEILLSEWNTDQHLNGSVQQGKADSDNALVTIYVGDSSTDIGCLASATIGLYICTDSTTDSVVQTLNRVGTRCLPLSQLQASNDPMPAQNRNERGPTIYIVQGFDEIDEWLSSWK